MKTSGRALLFVAIFILAVASLGRAQGTQTPSTDSLRQQIEQLENLDLRTASMSVQNSRSRNLLRLYNEYSSALENDIAALKKIQEIGGGDSESQSEISRLLAEQNRTADKMRALKNESQVPVVPVAPPATKASPATQKPQITPALYTAPKADPPPATSTIPETDSLARKVATQQGSKITLGGAHSGRRGTLTITIDSSINGPLRITVVDKDKRPFYTKVLNTKRNVNDYSLQIPLVTGTNTITVSDVGGTETATLDWEGEPDASELEEEADDPISKQRCLDHFQNNALKCPNSGLTGLLIGGVVVSQQEKNFSQSDPFMGFIVGYNTRPKLSLGGAVFHYRVQGIFQSQPQMAMAPNTFDPTDIQPFLASRKTFDIDTHLYMDMPIGHGQVRLGPYLGIGASTFLDKNEVQSDPSVTTDEGGMDTMLDTSQAQASNDLKRYYEFGLIGNYLRRDGELFMQTQMLYGNYEALAGLVPGHDTRNRFIGRLRVFPTGINLNPFSPKALDFSPMFGVELNAGRGPDQLRFFTGVAVSVTRFKLPSSTTTAETTETGSEGSGNK